MELILYHVQDSAFDFVEFNEVSVIPFLQFVEALPRAALLSSMSTVPFYLLSSTNLLKVLFTASPMSPF